MMSRKVKIIGYGSTLSGKEIYAEVIHETNTTITVVWNKNSRKFSKKTGYRLPNTKYDTWSGWRLDAIHRV